MTVTIEQLRIQPGCVDGAGEDHFIDAQFDGLAFRICRWPTARHGTVVLIWQRWSAGRGHHP
jgi:hypothetical protein